jgi:hypothetical protein
MRSSPPAARERNLFSPTSSSSLQVCCADAQRTSCPDARAAECCQALQGMVRVEHSIGRERARFPSLRCIPAFVKDAASHLLAIQWCVACSVLQNFATIHRDLSFEPSPGFKDIVPAPPPLHVPLVPSEKQLEDLGDGMEGTLQFVEDLLTRADAARSGLHA